MTFVYQNGSRAGRQPLLNTDRLWHTNRHIPKPCIPRKTDGRGVHGRIVAVRDNAVANHRTAKKLRSRVLLCQWKLSQWEDASHHSTASRIGRLLHPPAKFQSRLFDEFEQLRHGIRAVLRVQEGV